MSNKIKIFSSSGKLHWIKNLYLRLRYGAGCCDVFSLDYYLAKKIIRPLKEFKRSGIHSYPSQLEPKEWDDIIDKMIKGFDILAKHHNGDNVENKEWDEMQERLELFGKHFINLWK